MDKQTDRQDYNTLTPLPFGVEGNERLVPMCVI